MRNNFNLSSPQEFFIVKTFVGELTKTEINFAKINDLSQQIVNEFFKHGITISKNDVKIEHHCESKIGKITVDDGFDDISFSDSNSDFMDESFYYSLGPKSAVNNIKYTEHSVFVPITRVLIYLYAMVKNVNYESQILEEKKRVEEERRKIKEYNSTENAQRRKENNERSKLNKKIATLNDIENNPKAKESLIEKYGPNWKEFLMNKWNVK